MRLPRVTHPTGALPSPRSRYPRHQSVVRRMFPVRILTSSIDWRPVLFPSVLPLLRYDESTHLARGFTDEARRTERISCGIRIANSLFLTPLD